MADNNSQFWNPSKYITASYNGGVSYTYTPWMKNVTDDIALHNIAGFYKINSKQAISASLRYFSLGNIVFRDDAGSQTSTFKPNEFAIDFAYSRKLSENLSGAVAFRYFRSDLVGNNSIPNLNIETQAASAVAADISMLYTKQLGKNDLAVGLNISNIGPKISYSSDGEKSFIPTNLRLGARYTLNLQPNAKLSFLTETTKLLVPSPNYTTEGSITYDKNSDKTVLEGIFSSFGDAQGGFKEEMKEFTYSLGAEFAYSDFFALRTGYFHEAESKGNRKFITFGLGLMYHFTSFDFSYLVPTAGGSKSPLDNTFRFSVGIKLNQ